MTIKTKANANKINILKRRTPSKYGYSTLLLLLLLLCPFSASCQSL